MVNREDKVYISPIEVAIDVIGGKWKAQIYYALWYGPLRFSELSRSLPNITQRMLTNQLRELENDGIIDRKVYEQVPPRVDYSISEYGNTIKPILLDMYRWGYMHIKEKNLKYEPMPKPLRYQEAYVEDKLMEEALSKPGQGNKQFSK